MTRKTGNAQSRATVFRHSAVVRLPAVTRITHRTAGREARKIQQFNGVQTRELAMPVSHSNRLSYEATDVEVLNFSGFSTQFLNLNRFHNCEDHSFTLILSFATAQVA